VRSPSVQQKTASVTFAASINARNLSLLCGKLREFDFLLACTREVGVCRGDHRSIQLRTTSSCRRGAATFAMLQNTIIARSLCAFRANSSDIAASQPTSKQSVSTSYNGLRSIPQYSLSCIYPRHPATFVHCEERVGQAQSHTKS